MKKLKKKLSQNKKLNQLMSKHQNINLDFRIKFFNRFLLNNNLKKMMINQLINLKDSLNKI